MSAFNAFNENTDNLASSSLGSSSLAAPAIELSLSQFEKPIEVDLEKFFEFSFGVSKAAKAYKRLASSVVPDGTRVVQIIVGFLGAQDP